jgi:hypothetical protein
MFDLDVIVPLCGKFLQRIEDFKRYGLVNQGGRKVRVTVVLSGERIGGLADGWRGDFSVRVVENESSEYVANLYGFYLSLDPGERDSRWLVRLDDDSCTDVDGLVSNLDRFYGHEGAFYLGDLHPLQNALNGFEGHVYQHYRHLLGEYEPFGNLLMSEIECGIMNSAAVSKVVSNARSRKILEKRASLSGGYGDCAVALAAHVAGVHPVSCPFVTHNPLVHDFSLLGGVRNHIHMVARRPEGENFWSRCSPEAFMLLTKAVDGSPTDVERRLAGRRILVEDESSIRIFELKDGYRAALKLDHRRFNWYESEGEVLILDGDSVAERLKVGSDGSLVRDGASVSFL